MNMNNLTDMPVLGNEPSLTRAFAAEIRETPTAFEVFLREVLGEDFGHIVDVRCERPARADISVTLRDEAGIETVVGIEAKLAHAPSPGQLSKERDGGIDRLLLMVLEKKDALGCESKVDAIVTWEQTVTYFGESCRIRRCDLAAVVTPKLIAKRILETAASDKRSAISLAVSQQKHGRSQTQTSLPGGVFI